MANSIHVHLLPALMPPDRPAGGTVVVIDVLRASTTIVHALAAGARQVVPCAEVEQAREEAARLGPSALLGGERRGVPIDGFDLGNSPGEYTAAKVRDKTVVFTTTNGTQAMLRCRQAKRVLIGAFVNASAIADPLESEPTVDLLCAGTEGRITREDVLLAGMLTVDLASRWESAVLSDEAQLAADSWRQATEEVLAGVPLPELLAAGRGGRNLLDIGLAADIQAAGEIDAFELVPELNILEWHIRPA
jgi:2-phosphosulfolactate phosphatase